MTGQRISHYLLEERIGRGGMGEVYRARDLALGRTAAIKLIASDGDVAMRERLVREAESSARLQHPAIATFFEGGVDGRVAWLALEFVAGETLRTRLARGAFAASETIDLGTTLLEALAHAHAAGILHRDIKPENVMVRPDGSAKLLDFGLARTIGGGGDHLTEIGLTADGLAVGTVGYMPPEQLRGELIDVRADLFSLAAVVYECLGGRPAFPGRSSVERIAAVLGRDPDPLPAAIPSGVQQLIVRALARDPEARPATAGDFLRELRAVAAGADIVARSGGGGALAVADFENVLGDPADAWIGTGIAESVATDLARIEGLQVISRERWTDARSARGAPAAALDVAQSIGCRWVVAGSYQKVGPMLRITARLAEVASGHSVWADKLDGTLAQVFSMQDRLAGAVASALSARAPAARPSAAHPQLSAYECYVRGRRLFDRLEKGSMDQARELYEEAIARDPRLAAAHAGLAGMYAMRFTFTTDGAVLERAIAHATQALAIDACGGEPHVWRGYAYWRQEQHQRGLDEERAALAFDQPHAKAPYFAATILLDLDRPDEALPLSQRSVRIADAFPYAWLVLGLTHLRLDQHDEAAWCFEQARRLETSGPAAVIVGADAAAALVRRRLGDAVGARQRALEALERIEAADHMYRDTHRGLALSELGRAALAAGDREAAAAAFNQAVAHLRGRPRALGGGHLLVQALAGLSRAVRQPAPLDEAIALYELRRQHNFLWAFLANDVHSRVELALAAADLEHPSARALADAAFERQPSRWERDQIASASRL